jgi:hypothetical protein
MTERMTTHEGAPMSTHPEVVTLDPNDAEQMSALADAYYDALDYGSPAAAETAARAIRSMLPTPLPEEPPQWSAVRVASGSRVAFRMGVLSSGRNWQVEGYGKEWRTWPEVCALGTPEVLEPESAKALREQLRRARFHEQNNYSNFTEAEKQRDEARATVDKVRQFATACREQYEASDYSESISLDQVADSLEGLLKLAEDEPAEPAPVEVTEEPKPGTHLFDAAGIEWRRATGCERWHQIATPGFCEYWLDLRTQRGPLTLVETGGQS